MDVQYFINKFEAIHEDRWCTDVTEDGNGRRCANGHCGIYHPTEPTKESAALQYVMKDLVVHRTDGKVPLDSFYNGLGYSNKASTINNGKAEKYQQDTPKERILAALRDIQSMQKQEVLQGAEKVLSTVNWEPEDDELEDDEAEVTIECPAEC